MANKDAPFGFIPVRMVGGAYFSGGQDEYDIADDYNTAIFSGDIAKMNCPPLGGPPSLLSFSAVS